MRFVRSRLAAVAMIGVLLAVWIGATALRSSPPIDLAVYLRAGKMFAMGQGLYFPGWGAPLSTPLPYTYPPLWAAAVAPATVFPWRIVVLGWTAANVMVLVWIVRLSFREALGRAGPFRWMTLSGLAVVSTLTAPVGDVLWVGQLGILLTAACLADTVPDRTRLPRGMLVGAATAVKLIPGVFILYWLATKRWREASISTATAVGLWLFTAFLRPDLSREYWTEVVFRMNRVGGAEIANNQSLHGLLLRMRWGGPWVYVAVALATLALGMHRARVAHVRGDELAAACSVGITGLLVSPVSWIHHAIWIVPLVGVSLGDASDRRRWLLSAGVLALFMLRIPGWVESGSTDVGTILGPILENSYVLAFLAALFLLPLLRAERPSASARPGPAPHVGAGRRALG
jgi:alpha-1,2-mannosyltransferase